MTTATEKRQDEENWLKNFWRLPSDYDRDDAIERWKKLRRPPSAAFPQRIKMVTKVGERTAFRTGKWGNIKPGSRDPIDVEDDDVEDAGGDSDHEDATNDDLLISSARIEARTRKIEEAASRPDPPSPSVLPGVAKSVRALRSRVAPAKSIASAPEPGVKRPKFTRRIFRFLPSHTSSGREVTKSAAALASESSASDSSDSDSSQHLVSGFSNLSIGERPETPPPSSSRVNPNPDWSADRAPAHSTGRFYISVFLSVNDRLICPFSNRVADLQAAHMVPQALKKDVRRKLHRALGGFFTRNSRLNYFLIWAFIHTKIDFLKRASLIYPIQKEILEAMEDFLKFLSGKSDGEDWFQILRLYHPLLSDGHQYQYRLLYPFNSLASDHEPGFLAMPEPGSDDPRRKPVEAPFFDEINPAVSFTNPFLVTLKAILTLELGMGINYTAWKETNWESWVDVHPVLKALDSGRKEELVRFLGMAAKLRLRLGKDFSWNSDKVKRDNASLKTRESTTRSTRPSTKPPPPRNAKSKSRSQSRTTTTKSRGTGAQDAMDSQTLAYEWRVENNIPIPPPVSDPVSSRKPLWTLLRTSLKMSSLKENVFEEATVRAEGGKARKKRKRIAKAVGAPSVKALSGFGGTRRAFGMVN